MVRKGEGQRWSSEENGVLLVWPLPIKEDTFVDNSKETLHRLRFLFENRRIGSSFYLNEIIIFFNSFKKYLIFANQQNSHSIVITRGDTRVGNKYIS